jgi:hypothetical protein
MMAGVRAVGLRAFLVAPPRRGLSRLGQMHHRADRPQLLDHKPPAGRRLQRNLQLLASEPLKEPAHPNTVRRPDPRPTDLAADQIDPLHGDLRPVLVNPHHDRHIRQTSLTTRAASDPPTHRIRWSRNSTDPNIALWIGQERGVAAERYRTGRVLQPHRLSFTHHFSIAQTHCHRRRPGHHGRGRGFCGIEPLQVAHGAHCRDLRASPGA